MKHLLRKHVFTAKNVATIAIVAMVGLFIYAFIESNHTAQAALDAREETVKQFTEEQQALQEEVRNNRDQLTDLISVIGQQSAEIAALREQIIQLGGRPVAGDRTTTTTSGRSTARNGHKTPTTTTTTPRPSNPPTTTTTTRPSSPACTAAPLLCL